MENLLEAGKMHGITEAGRQTASDARSQLIEAFTDAVLQPPWLII